MRLSEIFSKRRKTDTEAPASSETVTEHTVTETILAESTPVESTLVEYTLTEDEQAALVHDARTAGMQNLPPTTATRATAAERRAIGRFAHKAAELRDAAVARLHALVDDFRDAASLPTKPEVDYVVKSTQASVQQMRRDAAGRLCRARQQFEEAEAHREHFKQTNKCLVRRAKSPRSSLEYMTSLLIVLLLESSMNAWFFASAGAGLLGGLLQAMLISSANISAAFLVGFVGVRALYHPGHLQRTMGKALVAGWAVCLLGFSLTTAKFRDAIAVAPDVASTLTLPALLRDPLAISFAGVLLFVVAVLAAMFACYKGAYAVEDVVEGYTEVERTYEEAKKAYEAELDGVRGPIVRAKKDGLHTCDGLLARGKNGVTQRSGKIQGIKATIHRHNKVALPGLTRSCEMALQQYRETNSRVATGRRGDPGYFDRFPAFDDQISCPQLGELEAEQAGVLLLMAELRSSLANARLLLADLSVEPEEASPAETTGHPSVSSVAIGSTRGPRAKLDLSAEPLDGETDGYVDSDYEPPNPSATA